MTWQVKDFADGWIDVADEAAARKLSAQQSDAAIRPKPTLAPDVTTAVQVGREWLAWFDAGAQGNTPDPPTPSTLRTILSELDRLSDALGEAREAGFRAGFRSGLAGAMNSGPVPDEDSEWLKYSRPPLSVVGD